LCIGHARDTTVEAVEHHGNEDRDRGKSKILARVGGITGTQGRLGAHRVDDGVKPCEQVRSGEQIRQQIDTTMPDFTTFCVVPFLDVFIDGQQAFGVRSLVRLFGTFAHGHYLATVWRKFDRCLRTTVRPQTLQLYTRTTGSNEKTRPRPRFFIQGTTT
jgi:hypothetical protein